MNSSRPNPHICGCRSTVQPPSQCPEPVPKPRKMDSPQTNEREYPRAMLQSVNYCVGTGARVEANLTLNKQHTNVANGR